MKRNSRLYVAFLLGLMLVASAILVTAPNADTKDDPDPSLQRVIIPAPTAKARYCCRQAGADVIAPGGGAFQCDFGDVDQQTEFVRLRRFAECMAED